MKYRIPFNKPSIVGKELEYIRESVEGGHTAGNGPFTHRAENLLAELTGAQTVLLTPSCTAALEITALLAGIAEGDEVILPSYTFVSTANAFALRGARLVFVDIRPDTLNLDEFTIEDAITERTKAIVPVHYAGVACEMDAINEIARRHDLLVIEDAAQGVNAWYKDRALGCLGDLGTFSFHETKNYICGEGGALVDPQGLFRERAEIVREKGTNRSQFFRGEVDKYTWVTVGSSYLASDIVAAFLLAQLEEMEGITAKRRALWEHYYESLSGLEERGDLRRPHIPSHCTANYHMFYIILASGEVRSQLIRHFRELGILAVFHYVPLHSSPMGKALGYRQGDLPVTEDLSERVLRLPLYYEMTQDEQHEVVAGLEGFFGSL